MEPVDGVGDDRDGCVKAKGKVSPVNVVVDCLGYADQLHLVIAPKIPSCRKRAFAADHNQARQSMGLPILLETLDGTLVLKRVEARSAENSSATRQNPRN